MALGLSGSQQFAVWILFCYDVIGLQVIEVDYLRKQ
jgi:hypothetical protein